MGISTSNSDITTLPNAVKGVAGKGTLTGVTAMGSSRLHVCAVSAGAAYCWGDNAYGQIGNNSTTDRKIPTLASVRNQQSTHSLVPVLKDTWSY